MAGNSFGRLFTISSFGESHGPAIGVVIDGCPPNIPFDFDLLRQDLMRRKPGQSQLSTSRTEEEEFEVLSGLFDGHTTGAPIAIIIRNRDQRPQDYEALKELYRPSHADYTYQQKYGIRDYRGGGRQSARETAARVMAGAVAKMILKREGLTVSAFVSQVQDICIEKRLEELDLSLTETNALRCPDAATALRMQQCIESVQAEGDSVGGVISCVCKGIPAGLGQPVFDKLHAELGKAILSINACKGFEIGSGFSGTLLKGSQHNDAFEIKDNVVHTQTNNSGGIQGGISNGMDIYFRAAFKPVSTIKTRQQTLNTNNEPILFEASGRHDPCVLPRAVPIVEAMAALVLVDFWLIQRAYR